MLFTVEHETRSQTNPMYGRPLVNRNPAADQYGLQARPRQHVLGDAVNASRALVIGGSLGGLMVAHLLRSIGWDAVVFERNDEELASRGVGLGTHPQLIAILKRAGIDFDETMGITLPRGVCLDATARSSSSSRWRARSAAGRGFTAPCATRCRREHYRFGKKLTRVEQDADGVTAIFADGTQRTRRSR